MNFLLIINFSLTLICIVHIGINLFNYLNPDNPSVKHYSKNLEDIEFPLIFKLCFELPEKNFQNFGYNHAGYFIFGQSMYNESLFGWDGHTENGTSLTKLQGKNYS